MAARSARLGPPRPTRQGRRQHAGAALPHARAAAGRHRDWALRTILSALVAVGLILVPASPSAATPPKPPTDWSWYALSYSPSWAYNTGCSQGEYDASHNSADSVVVLDFGGQTSGNTGTYLPKNGTYITYAQAESMTEQFARGYYVCTGSDTTSILYLSMGTNNYRYLGSSYGTAWGNVVDATAAWVIGQHLAGQVALWGANDIEPMWSSWSEAFAWASAYDAASPSLYIDFGSADGCPQTYYSSAGNTCANGWDQHAEWWVGWGVSAAVPLPQIYYVSQSNQWYWICKYAVALRGSKIFYKGPLDEGTLAPTTLSATQSWTTFSDRLNNDSATSQSMPYSAEMHDF